MRFSPTTVTNMLAWAVLGGLICAAVIMVSVLGFFGLLLLGVLTTLICVLAELNQDAPTWGVHVFKARMGGGGSPEQRAAMLADQQTFISPVRFYRTCGLVLAGLGAAGVAWQAWGSWARGRRLRRRPVTEEWPGERYVAGPVIYFYPFASGKVDA